MSHSKEVRHPITATLASAGREALNMDNATMVEIGWVVKENPSLSLNESEETRETKG